MNQLKNSQPKYSSDSSKCSVVCWGSSISRQAIENSDIMHQQISAYGKKIAVHKIYMLGLTANKLPDLYEIFEVTEQLKPSLICIEDNLFSHSKTTHSSKIEKEIRHLLSSWGLKARNSKQPHKLQNNTFDSHDERFDIPQQNDTLNISIILPPRTVRSFSDNQRINEQLKFALEQQIPLVILNVPRAGAVQKILIGAQEQDEIDKQIEEYKDAGFQIEYRKFPEYLPFKYYSDFGHMNDQGRAVYSRWLSKKIAEKLADQCH
jgi:hypothetical protein